MGEEHAPGYGARRVQLDAAFDEPGGQLPAHRAQAVHDGAARGEGRDVAMAHDICAVDPRDDRRPRERVGRKVRPLDARRLPARVGRHPRRLRLLAGCLLPARPREGPEARPAAAGAPPGEDDLRRLHRRFAHARRYRARRDQPVALARLPRVWPAAAAAAPRAGVHAPLPRAPERAADARVFRQLVGPTLNARNFWAGVPPKISTLHYDWQVVAVAHGRCPTRD